MSDKTPENLSLIGTAYSWLHRLRSFGRTARSVLRRRWNPATEVIRSGHDKSGRRWSGQNRQGSWPGINCLPADYSRSKLVCSPTATQRGTILPVNTIARGIVLCSRRQGCAQSCGQNIGSPKQRGRTVLSRRTCGVSLNSLCPDESRPLSDYRTTIAAGKVCARWRFLCATPDEICRISRKPILVSQVGEVMSEESDRMMVLLQELAALKMGDDNERNSPAAKKRRREISREMKQLALQKENARQ
jgi:hypothetical protein